MLTLGARLLEWQMLILVLDYYLIGFLWAQDIQNTPPRVAAGHSTTDQIGSCKTVLFSLSRGKVTRMANAKLST